MEKTIKGLWDDVTVKNYEIRTVDGEHSVVIVSNGDEECSIALEYLQVKKVIKALEEAIS